MSYIINQNSELLRFTTAGSVDDGKSTLIGRLLYDSKSIFEDQYEAMELYSQKKGDEHINLALLTDGLRAEREQGITIDVAYRHFATPTRRFIIADTPGHIEYTRNMVTGASTANTAVILIDAQNGVTEQTLRHTFIASLLQIPHIIVCVNKMDLVDYSEECFLEIKNNFIGYASKMDIQDVHFIPISALLGDNVVTHSPNTPWYGGSALLYLLENLHIGSDFNHIDARFPVQYVIRPHLKNIKNFRGFAGQIAGGVFKVGDTVKVLPSGVNTVISSISLGDNELEQAYSPQSVVIQLADDIDTGRGSMLVRENNLPVIGNKIDIMFCWLHNKALRLQGHYLLKHTSADTKCMIDEIVYKIDIQSLERRMNDSSIGMNDIGRMRLSTSKPLFYDSYRKNRITGSIILIDAQTNETLCAGMIV